MTLLDLCIELNVQLKEPRNLLDLCVEFKNLKLLACVFTFFCMLHISFQHLIEDINGERLL
jgi:hypothetical protein